MARINIEDCWWTDPRRSILIKSVGSEELADGSIIKAWRLAQEFWKKGKGLVPKDLFETLNHHQLIIDSKLATVEDSFVYVRGSSAYLDWVREKREQASDAGKKSAKVRAEKLGSAQPNGGKGSKKPNENRTKRNGTEPSDSGSISVSSSVSGLDSGSESLHSKKTNRFISRYCENFKFKYGSNPEIRGKEVSTAKRLAKDLSEEKINLYIDAYFDMPDAYVIKAKHPMGLLEMKFNEVTVFANSGEFTTNQQARQADDTASNMILLQKVRAGQL